MKSLLTTILSCLVLLAFAQEPKVFVTEKAVSSSLSDKEPDFFPTLFRLEAPEPGGASAKAKREKLRAELSLKYPKQAPGLKEGFNQRNSAPAVDPVLRKNFLANPQIQGVPNDNDMAISKDYLIATVVNSNLNVYDTTGSRLRSRSLANLASPLNIMGTKFDPRVLYDPNADRFVIVFLNGFSSMSSHIMVGFSQTNDPAGDWNMYAITGTPDGDSTWTDFPNIALTEKELFITGNIIYDGMSWQLGFKKSVCWQINLQAGYQGDSLVANLWDNFLYQGKPIRNLSPAQGGKTPSGPKIHLLSNRNFDAINDTFFIAEITDTIGGSPSTNVKVAKSNNTYHFPPNASQSDGSSLSTNDSRVLDAIYENGKIQFVGNTMDTTTGFAAVYHGIIVDPDGTPSINLEMISDHTLEYGYPAIMTAERFGSSDKALIAVNFTGTTVLPGNGAYYFDGSTYSNLVIARPGFNNIDVLSGPDRWGDYTGIQYHYGDRGAIWVAATYGMGTGNPGNWVSEYLVEGYGVGLAPVQPTAKVEIAPNPVTDVFSIDFELGRMEEVSINLYDMQGRLVSSLLQDFVRPGTTRFSFNISMLPAGTYLLQVLGSNQKKIASEQLVKP